MIKQLQLENVRLFEGRWNFSLPPLTVLCGTNSAGKSTILKTLILLRQSQGIGESDISEGGRLRLAGSQVDLGTYGSFVSHNDVSRDISISITIEDEMPVAQYLLMSSLTSRKSAASTPDHSEEQGVLYRLRADFTFGLLRPEGNESSIAPIFFRESEAGGLEIHEDAPSIAEALLKNAQFELTVDGEKLLQWEMNLLTVEGRTPALYEFYVPQKYLSKVGRYRKMGVRKSDRKGFIRVATTVRGLLPDSIVATRLIDNKSRRPDTKDEPFDIWPLPGALKGSLFDLQKALKQIYYLGPLRSPAKRYYGLDSTGEFLPDTLREKGASLVWNLRKGETSPHRESLSSALDGWLFFLRTGEQSSTPTCSEIEISTTKDIILELRVKNLEGTESHALADSGFGYSQVLPIIIQGLLAEPGSTLIIEQPELHLNPALQVRLASFFGNMVKAGKQILIETHSEHIVNAVRVLAAEDESGELSRNCGIFFIEAGFERPTLHELSVKEDGTVPEWPHHFFGEAISLTGRLLRAQKRFRNLKAG